MSLGPGDRRGEYFRVTLHMFHLPFAPDVRKFFSVMDGSRFSLQLHIYGYREIRIPNGSLSH